MLGSTAPNYPYRASLWAGTAASWVDLHPEWAGATDSIAYSVYEGCQVGEADVDGFTQASFWTGSAASWMSLNSPPATYSVANAVYGDQVAGEAGILVEGVEQEHAILWTLQGTNWTWGDLNPEVATGSSAHGVWNGQQVGDAGVVVDGAERECASLWTGTVASWVNLHPDVATASGAMGVCDGVQVGSATVNGAMHASLWTGTKESWVDLHVFLPQEYTSSYANGVWRDGATTYVVGVGNDGGVLMWVTSLDSDGDGIPDAFDRCPNTIPGVPVDASGCPPVIPGDFDRDGDVDDADVESSIACHTGRRFRLRSIASTGIWTGTATWTRRTSAPPAVSQRSQYAS